MKPLKVKVRDKEFLDITWDNGKENSLKLSNLRNQCPCALCNAEKDEWSPSYIPLYTREQLNIVQIKVVGTYALGIEWEDGHNTGIYDYEYLYKLFEQFLIK
jgi:ATP-binding protein involved in chromosome partitioning